MAPSLHRLSSRGCRRSSSPVSDPFAGNISRAHRLLLVARDFSLRRLLTPHNRSVNRNRTQPSSILDVLLAGGQTNGHGTLVAVLTGMSADLRSPTGFISRSLGEPPANGKTRISSPGTPQTIMRGAAPGTRKKRPGKEQRGATNTGKVYTLAPKAKNERTGTRLSGVKSASMASGQQSKAAAAATPRKGGNSRMKGSGSGQ